MSMHISFFLQLQSQVRVLHWQTKSYEEHKALGKLYDALDPLVDKFVEVHAGKYGNTLGNPNFSFSVSNYKDSNSMGIVQMAIEFLTNELPKKLNPNTDTDLLNIRDEMVGALNRTKYLLRLE
jgi:hypothetical protein